MPWTILCNTCEREFGAKPLRSEHQILQVWDPDDLRIAIYCPSGTRSAVWLPMATPDNTDGFFKEANEDRLDWTHSGPALDPNAQYDWFYSTRPGYSGVMSTFSGIPTEHIPQYTTTRKRLTEPATTFWAAVRRVENK